MTLPEGFKNYLAWIARKIIGLIALCFAEVGSSFSTTGGPYLYAKKTFGSPLAFMVGWLMWLTRVAGFATLAQVFVAYLGYFWPPAESGVPRVAIITGLMVCLTVINIIGVKESARTSNIFTVSKLDTVAGVSCRRIVLYQPGTFHACGETKPEADVWLMTLE